jgi:hypothetical protein
MLHVKEQPLLLLLAAFLAAIIGYANRTGGTCTVAAVQALIADKNPWRPIALIKCSL